MIRGPLTGEDGRVTMHTHTHTHNIKLTYRCGLQLQDETLVAASKELCRLLAASSVKASPFYIFSFFLFYDKSEEDEHNA